VALLLVLGFAACGGNSNNPSGGNSCNNVSVLGSARGRITATIDGANFDGGVPAGASIYTPITPFPGLGIPALDFINIGGTCGDNTSLHILALAGSFDATGAFVLGRPGTTAFGLGAAYTQPPSLAGQPLPNLSILTSRPPSGVASLWNTSTFLGGSGSITFTQVSSASAAGSFTMTMAPQAGTGATGNKQVNGTFSVTF
jgi:hypothetical protein